MFCRLLACRKRKSGPADSLNPGSLINPPIRFRPGKHEEKSAYLLVLLLCIISLPNVDPELPPIKPRQICSHVGLSLGSSAIVTDGHH